MSYSQESQAQITKALEEEKQTLLEQIKELDEKLESLKTILIKPTKVLVHWSESHIFGEEQELDFDDFENRAYQVAMTNGHVHENGYTKTKITVFFEGDHEYQCRLDLALGDEVGFQDHMQQMIDCKKPEFIYLYKDNIEFAKQIDYSRAL